MSRASEWAASGERWRTNRPVFEGGAIYATVTETGLLSCRTGGRDFGESSAASREEVVAFIAWLQETFTE